MRKWLVVAVALAAGCKKDTHSTVTAPAAPTSTKDQDALWALAPDGAQFGLVASPRGVASVEGAMLAVRAFLASAPDLAPANAAIDRALSEATGSPTLTLADLGMTRDKGFALFAEDKGVLAVLPVIDRDKFLAKVKGTKGTDADRIADATCKTIKDVYMCAKPAALLDGAGKGKLVDGLRAAGARGEIEVAAVFGPGAPTLALVAQLAKGAIVVRGTVSHVPPIVTSKLGAPVKPRVDGAASGFATINLKPLLDGVPAEPLVAGVTLADLAKSIGGPLALTMANGGIGMDVHLPLSDPKPMQTLIEHCTDVPPLAMVGAKLVDGACHVPVPQYGFEVDAWVEGGELRIGKRGAPAPATHEPLPPIGAEIANGEWSFALFGHGTLLALPKLPPMPELPPEALVGFHAASMLNELGLAARADGDAIKFIASVRTAWSNPDDIVAKLTAITPQQIGDGKALEAARAIADAAPTSPFAADFKAGIGGMMALAAPIGVLAAVAIPAFMDYMKKSKRTEASLELNRLGKRAKLAYAENASYPKGDAPLTPAASCCTGPNAKCVTTAKDWDSPVWKALDFEISEPHLYRYSYHSDGSTFTATAVGDLDCDGTEVTYTLTGDTGGMLQLAEPTNRD